MGIGLATQRWLNWRMRLAWGFFATSNVHYPATHGLDAITYFKMICGRQLAEQTSYQAEARLQIELEVIHNAGLANYFLIVCDNVPFAREHGILCQGHGSAPNSLVAHWLGITRVDPLAHHLVFEWLLSHERQIAPDIDFKSG